METKLLETAELLIRFQLFLIHQLLFKSKPNKISRRLMMIHTESESKKLKLKDLLEDL
jgi:hypothetical protein